MAVFAKARKTDRGRRPGKIVVAKRRAFRMIARHSGLARGRNSAVECNLAKVEVGSSNLLARSMPHLFSIALPLFAFGARSPSPFSLDGWDEV
jgi:hypothetical protein